MFRDKNNADEKIKKSLKTSYLLYLTIQCKKYTQQGLMYKKTTVAKQAN